MNAVTIRRSDFQKWQTIVLASMRSSEHKVDLELTKRRVIRRAIESARS